MMVYVYSCWFYIMVFNFEHMFYLIFYHSFLNWEDNIVGCKLPRIIQKVLNFICLQEPESDGS